MIIGINKKLHREPKSPKGETSDEPTKDVVDAKTQEEEKPLLEEAGEDESPEKVKVRDRDIYIVQLYTFIIGIYIFNCLT